MEIAKGLVKVKLLEARRAKVEAIAFGTESQLGRDGGERLRRGGGPQPGGVR